MSNLQRSYQSPQEVGLPDHKVIRQRIDICPREDIKMALRTAYLYAGRISEVVGASSPGDDSTARGPRGDDVTMARYDRDDGDVHIHEDVVLFTVRTAKRGGKIRYIGIPARKEYEPWALELYDYFKRFDKELVFPFTRQLVGQQVHQHLLFTGIKYQVEAYTLWADGKLERKVKSHPREFVVHAIRHVRPTELVVVNGFDAVDLATYTGWTLKSLTGIGMMDRYVSLDWQKYFPKLLRRAF